MACFKRPVLSSILAACCLIVLLGLNLRISTDGGNLRFTIAGHKVEARAPYPNAPTGKMACKGKDKIRVFTMMKVPKTGSSTLYTIFVRFALVHKLNVLLPKICNQFHIKIQGNDTWVIGPDRRNKADVVFNHMIYNEAAIQRLMKPGYNLLFSVREPVSWFKSAVKFYSNPRNIHEKLAENIIVNGRQGIQRQKFHLRQLRYLGFYNNNENESLATIQEYISKTVPKIDVPVLNDKFDASLIVMRRRFCWDYTDIFYKMSTVTNSSTMTLSKQAVKRLLAPTGNQGDQLLYTAMERKWFDQPEVKETDFWEEVSYFTSLNRRLSRELCAIVNRMKKPYPISSNQFHDDMNITVTLCRRLKLDKTGLRACIRNYALGTTLPKNIIC